MRGVARCGAPSQFDAELCGCMGWGSAQAGPESGGPRVPFVFESSRSGPAGEGLSLRCVPGLEAPEDHHRLSVQLVVTPARWFSLPAPDPLGVRWTLTVHWRIACWKSAKPSRLVLLPARVERTPTRWTLGRGTTRTARGPKPVRALKISPTFRQNVFVSP